MENHFITKEQCHCTVKYHQLFLVKIDTVFELNNQIFNIYYYQISIHLKNISGRYKTLNQS